MIDKGLRKNIKKKKRRDGEIGKHKLNEMGALTMKYKNETNQIKVKDPHILQLFLNMAAPQKHIWSSGGKKAIPEHLYFSKNFSIILYASGF